MNNKLKDNHHIPEQCKNEFDPVNSAFHTVKYKADAGSIDEMPGSELGYTHGTDSDSVSHLVNMEIKPGNHDDSTFPVEPDPEPVSICIPNEDTSLYLNNEYCENLNAAPVDAPW